MADYQLFSFEMTEYLFYLCAYSLIATDMSVEKNKYFQTRNKRAIPIRFNAEEMTLLQTAMEKDDWTNVSGFIKYKIFGLNYTKKIDELVVSRESEPIGRLLLNATLQLAEQIEYLNYRYNKDMQQLWREEGTDWKEWAKVTKQWHRNMLTKTEEALTLIRRSCEILNVKEYFEMPSDSMNIDPETATKAEMDALAAQLQKERIAMGRIEMD